MINQSNGYYAISSKCSTLVFRHLFQRCSSTQLQAFTNYDLADGCDWLSTGGYCVFLGQDFESWSLIKHWSKYKTIVNAIAGLKWTQSLLHKLGLTSSHPIIWCDNIGTCQKLLSLCKRYDACTLELLNSYCFKLRPTHDVLTKPYKVLSLLFYEASSTSIPYYKKNEYLWWRQTRFNKK